ncbi:MAG: bifunctional isocitrate dehydrogenase kinase/phosphatase [Gammaproteobacteria bacterium]|nr:bifunctional isocitrate dehydrogenase kinase/phosphatase [Gammaproteobacteria bacterium]
MPEPRADRVQKCARAIFRGYVRYNFNFRRITQRARGRFETRDWKGGQQDLVERIELYTKSVDRILETLRRDLGEAVADPALWHGIKVFYGKRVEAYPDAEFAKTYFCSVVRRIFDIVGIDPAIEFVAGEMEPTTHLTRPVDSKIYINWGSLRDVFRQILADFSFSVRYRNLEASTDFAVGEIEHFVSERGGADAILRFELIQPIFYQSTRAYLAGRIIGDGWTAPLLVSLRNGDAGIDVDAVICSEDEVSTVFGFTRSYFFVDLETVGSAVSFLKALLPRKPIGELYTALGRARQGKTERFRILTKHLHQTSDRFVHAPGDKGLVMLVFTLPSYGLVFKLIRDRAGYPKNISRDDVVNKYQLVFKHDRAGRLIDTQEFLHLEFPIARFAPELIDELLSEAANTVHVSGDELVIDHLYIERRLRPLNLYLREVERPLAEQAVLDYGQCIRDLALTNIFPGDLLLKNFGVTRHGRVIFYDYDELCLVTDCRFRDLPPARDEQDEMRQESWFYVGDNDIFPEQFIRFLAMDAGLKRLFLEAHQDLLSAEFWRRIKAQHLANEVPEVLPYYRPFGIPPGEGRMLAS